MRRIWSLRNPTNFIITVLGTSSVGLYGYSMYKQQQFAHPIVNESVKVLSQNEKLRQMLGYPLSYQASLGNTKIDKEDQVYYGFRVVGPRATIEVQMNTSSIEVGKVINQQLRLESDIDRLQQQVQLLKTAINNQKDKQQKKIRIADLKVNQSELQLKKQKLVQEKIKNEKKIQKYYVPEQQLYKDIVSKKAEEQLSYDTRLWGIDSLVIQMPNRTKITIIDDKLKPNQPQSSNTSAQNSKKEQMKPFTSPYIRNRIIQNILLNEDEINQYSKHKTNFMYSKYGSYRMIMIICVAIGISISIVMFSKNRYKSVVNSVLIFEAEKTFLNNKKIQKIIKDRNIRSLRWNQNIIGGGRRGLIFDCQVDVQGMPGAQVNMSGRYSQKQEKNIYDTFNFQYKDHQNKIVNIDLLN